MRAWLRDLACRAATEMWAEARQMGAHGAMRSQQLCLTDRPMSCIPVGITTIRRSKKSIGQFNLRSNAKCNPPYLSERP